MSNSMLNQVLLFTPHLQKADSMCILHIELSGI